MKKLSRQVLYALIGASGALTGLVPVARCAGQCATCFGCAGIGLGIFLVLIGQKIRGDNCDTKEGSDGRV